MPEVFIDALVQMLAPAHLLALLVGVLLGLLFGAIPGLGGTIGLAILLPFTLGMEPSVAIALLLGLLSVINTGDTVPAVLFGVPGSAGAQATVLDGHALAKRGEAERALYVATVASIFGGLFGALVLALSIPVMRPIVFAFGSPEFLAMAIMGITMVAVLSPGNLVRGLMVACLGLLIGSIGQAPQTAFPRWTFGEIYFLDGIPLVPVILGLFAVPEMIELHIRGTSLAPMGLRSKASIFRRIGDAVRETLRHWGLVLRCSALGALLGAVPGIGATVIDWFAYGHAAATAKGGSQNFGKGDIRGVIAPESANNSKSGGQLIPTLAFGIPGSLPMAIFLGALLIHDIRPGNQMITRHLDLTVMMIWSIALANLAGGILLLLLARQFARITVVPAAYLVPTILVISIVAAFLTTFQPGDLVVLAVFSLLGWILKAHGWPRPPLILALVLGPLIEQYYSISVGRYGAEWVTRPIVLIILALTFASILFALIGNRRRAKVSWKTSGGN